MTVQLHPQNYPYYALDIASYTQVTLSLQLKGHNLHSFIVAGPSINMDIFTGAIMELQTYISIISSSAEASTL